MFFRYTVWELKMASTVFINKNHKPLNPQDLPSRNPDVQTFHQSLPHYNKTPLVPLPEIAKELGVGQILLKNESKRFGLSAFKILGVSKLIPAQYKPLDSGKLILT